MKNGKKKSIKNRVSHNRTNKKPIKKKDLNFKRKCHYCKKQTAKIHS
jgi:hypothetical protein